MKKIQKSYKEEQFPGTATEQVSIGGRLLELLQRLHQLFLLLTPLSFNLVRNSSGLPMSLWSFRSSWMPSPRLSKRLACAAVTLGVPSALTRAVILVWTLFCCIHSLICLAGERISRLGRHLTREGCVRTHSMAKTSGKARCAPAIAIYISIIIYHLFSLPSTSVPTILRCNFSNPRDFPRRILSPSFFI